MRSFKLPHKADAVFSACDGVNYLIKDEGALSFFKSALDALKPGGAFAFDVSSPEKLTLMAQKQRYFEETEDTAYIWVNELSGNLLKMEITFFVQRPDGLYERAHETHRQRLWQETELTALMETAGFTNIKSENTGERIYFSAKKPI